MKVFESRKVFLVKNGKFQAQDERNLVDCDMKITQQFAAILVSCLYH